MVYRNSFMRVCGGLIQSVSTWPATMLPESRSAGIFLFWHEPTGRCYVSKRMPKTTHRLADWPREGIGVLPDGYGGSGKIIKAMRRKYPREEFRWRVLRTYQTEADAYRAERCWRSLFGRMYKEQCVNLADGGEGFTSREVKKHHERLRAKAIVADRSTGWATQTIGHVAFGPEALQIGGRVGGPLGGATMALASAMRRAKNEQLPWPTDNQRLHAAGLPPNALPVVERHQPAAGTNSARVLAEMLAHPPMTIAEIAARSGLWSPGRHGKARNAMGALRACFGYPIVCIANRFYIEGHHARPEDGTGPVFSTIG